MRLQSILPNVTFMGAKKQNKFNSYGNFTKLPDANDTFEKHNSEVSFTSRKNENKDKNKNIEDNLGSSLSSIKMKGLPFLLGVVASTAMVKMGEKAVDLLCDSNGYIVSEDGVTSSLVNIDTDNQILNFSGTDISINADDYDYVDWENGIFRNHDGSVDINLGENRFIDTTKGIFIDPDEQVAGVLDKGVMQPIAVPDFQASFGSGYPTCPWDDRWATLQSEYARRHPEMLEHQSPLEKAAEFFKKIFKKDTMPETEGVKDIFGNEIISAKDKDGDTYLASYFQKEIDSNPIFKDIRSKFGKEEATEQAGSERLQNYIKEKYPNFGTRVLVYEGGRHAGGNGIYTDDYSPADANKDGKLSKEEMQAYIQNLSKDKKGRLDEEGLSNFLKMFDKNNDGKITLKEVLEALDTDSNGFVSLKEFLAGFDLNSDGKTTIGEILRGLSGLITGK